MPPEMSETSTENARRPKIALTMGDAAGVGPEICLKVLQDATVNAVAAPVIYGDERVLARCAERTGLPMPGPGQIHHLDKLVLETFVPRTCDANTGAAAVHYFQTAIDDALNGRVDAISTAPLNKEAMHAAGFRYPGHTEILAERTGAAHSCMMQYSEEIACTFVTVHVGYAEVPKLLTTERVWEVIQLTDAALRRIRRKSPHLCLLGLNPHAGEHGLFGNREEETILQPAIERARAAGITIDGPVSPDTAFLPWKRRSTDAFVCLYHDQGHIPVKALAFESAVNTTLGLPIIRTSCDHGTATDIAWNAEAKADYNSLRHAIRLAAQLARGF
jgi:4-hydroxythreonine-4-phosphate dehydrogenase